MKKFLLLFFFTTLNIIFSYANGIWVYDTQEDWEQCELDGCDIVSENGSVKILNTVSDEFNTIDLNPAWIWEDGGNGTEVYGTYLLKNYWLQITAYQGSEWMWGEYKAPRIYQPVDINFDFEIETKIDIDGIPFVDWKDVILFLKGDDDINEKIFLQVNIGSGGKSIELFEGWNSIKILPLNGGVDIVYLKIKKVNFTIYAYYKLNENDDWTYIGEKYINFNEWKYLYCGVAMKDTSQTNSSKFDYFHYTGPTRTAASVIDTIDFGDIPQGQGIIRWEQDPGLYGNIKIRTATSPDGVNWTDWSNWYNNNLGSNIESPNQRYLKFQAKLETTDYRYSPVLRKIEIEYPVAAPNKPIIISNTHKENEWSNTNNAYFEFTGADSNGVTVAGYYYEIDGEITSFSAYTENNYINITRLAEGIHSLKVMAQADWRNNSLYSQINKYEFKIDITKPKKPEKIWSNFEEYKKENYNNFNIKLNLEDSKTNTENVSGIKGVSYILTKDENEEVDNIIEQENGDISISGIDNGRWIFKAVAVDNAGNTSEEFKYVIEVEYTGKAIEENGVKIYPNPSREKVNINYKLNLSVEEVKIYIIDSGGRKIKTINGDKNYGENNIYINNIKNFANGVYFVKIQVRRKDGKQESVVKKLVVVK